MKADLKIFVLAVGLVGACSCSAPPREPIAGVSATSPPIENHDTDSDGHGAMAPSASGEGTGGVSGPPFTAPPATPGGAEAAPEKEVVLGSDGQPIGVAERVRYTTGPGSCPPTDGETCPIGKNERCEVHERVTCQPECRGYRTQRYTCENGSWGLRETLEAPCRCGPLKPSAALESCDVRYVSVNASSLSPTDGCTVGLSCAGHQLWVECDGENDGTNTSLCECWRDRYEANIGGPFPGEGPDACFAAAADCIEG